MKSESREGSFLLSEHVNKWGIRGDEAEGLRRERKSVKEKREKFLSLAGRTCIIRKEVKPWG